MKRTLSGAALAPVLALSSALLLTLVWGCEGPAEAPPPAEPGVFDHPQALLFVDGLLVVANSGFRHGGPDAWAPGSLTVLDPTTGAVRARIPTSRPNPQALRRHGDWLYVVDTGPLDLGDAPQAGGEGAIDIFHVAGLAEGRAPATTHILPPAPADRRLGAPVDLAVRGERVVITSAVADIAWVLDRARGAWARGPADPIRLGDEVSLGLGAVRPWAGGFALVDFNADRLHLLGPTGIPSGCAIELGEHPDVFEGVGAPVVAGATLYALASHAGLIRAVELDDLADDCAAPVRTVARGLGQVPNDMALHDGRLFVVASGDNAVRAYDPADGRRTGEWLLPVNSNPFSVAFDGRTMAVSEWAAHGVSLFDLDTGAVRRVAPAPDPGAPDGGLPPPASDPMGTPSPADVVVDAPAVDGPFADPERAVNGVRGAGAGAGGTDVFSLPPDGRLTLRWSERVVRDGPGIDFVVFENPFRHGGGVFFDPLIVELSADGERWFTWPHRLLPGDGATEDPSLWQGFAGLTPVWLHAEDNPVDPFGPAAGGDGFDLSALPDAGEAGRIRREGFRFIRLVSAAGRADPQTGAAFPSHPVSDGPDIDGVYGRWFDDDPR